MIHWELWKKFKFDYTNKWYMHNLESVQENETYKILRFWGTNGSSNLSQTTSPSDNQQQQQKKRTSRIVDFVDPVDYRVKLKENKERNKYLNLARELKQLWNMKVTVVPMVIGALSTGLIQRLEDLEIRERVAIIQTTALLRSTRILERVLETWEEVLSLRLRILEDYVRKVISWELCKT